jgi:hypothetical protein
MIEINKYYRVATREGMRTVKAQQQVAVGIFHGIYSLSDCAVLGDNEDIQIPQDSQEASNEQAQIWEGWYNG